MYFDTSVLGALADRDERRRLALTRTMLGEVAAGRHAGIRSNVVNEELERASSDILEAVREGLRIVEFEIVVENKESQALFAEYASAKIVPARYQNDLRRVGRDSCAGRRARFMKFSTHLVNVNTRRAVHAVNMRLGYPMIEIVSPEEV